MKTLPGISRTRVSTAAALALLALTGTALSQGTTQATPAQTTPVQPAPAATAPDKSSTSGEITEDQLKQQLVGKPLFLRGGYLGDSLSFNEHGEPTGHPTPGSYTLSAVQIDKVRLTKHKVELEGSRYALHFLGATPYEDQDKAVDRVKITPKKKVLKITIDREQVLKPKKEKDSKENKKENKAAKGKPPESATAQPAQVASSETDSATPPPAQDKPATATPAPESAPAPASDQATDQAADQASVTSTTSPAHAAQILHEALDRVFATGLDEKLRAQMPEFWQLYYQAQAAHVDYRPHDPKILRSTAVDQQAKLTSAITPESNEYAQANAIAGRALYRVVIDSDGKPAQIAVIRPIGFGLDENAVQAIRKATFQPATKAGQPVAETLDLAVLFRIYSKKTAATAPEKAPEEASKPVLPGPYTSQRQQQQPQPQPQPDTQPAAPTPADSSQPQSQSATPNQK